MRKTSLQDPVPCPAGEGLVEVECQKSGDISQLETRASHLRGSGFTAAPRGNGTTDRSQEEVRHGTTHP
jgi:hypothetical protein